MYELRVHPTLRDFGEQQWRSLLGDAPVPFMRFEWLDALEQTQCVGEDAGWYPHHLSLWEKDKLIAGAPGYLKTNSQGEFVFDHAWANASRRFGVRYFPKLLIAVPFTPATASRILVAPDADRAAALRAFASGIAQVTETTDLSSAHILFPGDAEAKSLADAGFAHRFGIQFHWENQGFEDFEGFLATLPSKKRTQVRRERKALVADGVTIETLRGSDVTPEIVDFAFEIYCSTVDKFSWGRRYLNRAFFEEVCAKPDSGIEVVVASDGNKRKLAGAVNLVSATTLFGRYWGALEERPFLHFNVCYYHSVADAIERKLQRFEPGAGGSHKVARGFFPTITNSLHHLSDPSFAAAIHDFVERERDALVAHISADWGMSPRRVG